MEINSCQKMPIYFSVQNVTLNVAREVTGILTLIH
jgi:hypothetical protein